MTDCSKALYQSLSLQFLDTRRSLSVHNGDRFSPRLVAAGKEEMAEMVYKGEDWEPLLTTPALAPTKEECLGVETAMLIIVDELLIA